MKDADYQRLYDEVDKELVTPEMRKKLHLLTKHAQDPAIEELRQQLAASQAECERLQATECGDLTNQLAQAHDIDTLRHQLAAMTAARDEACDIAAAAAHMVSMTDPRSHMGPSVLRVIELRQVGSTGGGNE